MGPNFMVDKTGVLIASGAIFEGTITASAGFIGFPGGAACGKKPTRNCTQPPLNGAPPVVGALSVDRSVDQKPKTGNQKPK